MHNMIALSDQKIMFGYFIESCFGLNQKMSIPRLHDLNDCITLKTYTTDSNIIFFNVSKKLMFSTVFIFDMLLSVPAL